MPQTATPHGFVTKTLHWVSAALLGFGYVKGLDSVTQLADPALFRFEIGFALSLGAVFLLRLLWTKAVAGASRLPEAAPGWEHAASRVVHGGLYASVFLIVLSGLGIALAYATPILGGLFLGAMLGLHELALAALPLFLLVHVAGALWHKLIRRDGVLESMTGALPV
ncbi:cytochrome b [Dinoroseobacter sp. S375]|uniref:cytochrome b n=1 Tax=Dinoroseobacter sp. S375 TaxID=3415136 RepID=UPI003C79D73E